MISARSEIRRILREREHGRATGLYSVQQILQAVQKQVISDLASATVSKFDVFFLNQMKDSLEVEIERLEGRLKKTVTGLLDGQWEKGEELVTAPLKATGISAAIGGYGVSTNVLNVIKDFSANKITDITRGLKHRIESEVILGVLGQQTPYDVMKRIGTDLKNPSIFKSVRDRAFVITNTEMGRVFSMATQERISKAAKLDPDLKKQWLHDGHPKKPRRTHQAAHEQIVNADEPFVIGSELLMYPRDPGAPANEVVNCTCNHVPWYAAWDK